MKRITPIFESQDIEKRAAEVRRGWSISERVRRTGLPPDMPISMRLWSVRADRATSSNPGWSVKAAYAASRARS